MSDSALIECVPNFSVADDLKTIGKITDAISSVDGVSLLDVDPGLGANRTVVTFAGSPAAVMESAFQGIRVAARQIDMRKHHGEHPRIGATDVCPLIPLNGITMEEVVGLSKILGERVARELGIPVYLYERSAPAAYRQNLAHIRSGEYEGLRKKMLLEEWAPDFGPATFNPRSGATVIGARPFLIAYNVNLNTDSVPLAKAIAADIRESGRLERDKHDKPVRIPGLCRSLKAIGWYIEEYGCAQVSMNLTDIGLTPMHVAYEVCRKQAATYGLEVTGSELVGMVPLQALLSAGGYFLGKENSPAGWPERKLIETAVNNMGLDALRPFNSRKKIIEYRMEDLAGNR